MFKKHLRLEHSVTKDQLGRASTLANARLRVKNGRAYLTFSVPYDEAISTSTLRELASEGWREEHSHCLFKVLR